MKDSLILTGLIVTCVIGVVINIKTRIDSARLRGENEMLAKHIEFVENETKKLEEIKKMMEK